MEYNTQVGIFETGEKDSQGGAYKDNRFLALRKRELNEYEVKEGVAIIGDRAFYDAKLRTVTLPNTLRAIGQSAFAGCKNLTDVALPEGLEVIKDTAFRDCESLAELTLPSTLLEVGARAFGPGLKRLVILSENVTFSPDAFKQAKSLEEIHVPEAACAKYTVWFVALGLTAKITEIKEKNEIEESNTGNNNETLMKSIMNNNVSGIISDRLEALIAAALQDGVLTDKERELLKRRAEKEGEDWDEVEMIIEARLAEMQTEIVSAATPQMDAIELKDADELNNEGLRYYNSQNYEEAVKRCFKAADVHEKTNIFEGDYDRKVKNIVIPEGVTVIAAGTCSNLLELENLTLPSTLVTIESRAFSYCRKLKTVDFTRCKHLKEIEDKAFWDCEKLEEVDFSLCTQLKRIGDEAFAHCYKLVNIVLPDSVTFIGQKAFARCRALRLVVLPASLEKLEDEVFLDCELDNLDMSKVTHLSTIPKGFGCTKTMMIPQGVTTIAESGLKNRSWRNEKLFLPSTLESYGNRNGRWEAIYLYAPQFEDLETLLEDNNILYVLPQYLNVYKELWEALGKPNKKAEILPMPDEYLYYYDN